MRGKAPESDKTTAGERGEKQPERQEAGEDEELARVGKTYNTAERIFLSYNLLGRSPGVHWFLAVHLITF